MTGSQIAASGALPRFTQLHAHRVSGTPRGSLQCIGQDRTEVHRQGHTRQAAHGAVGIPGGRVDEYPQHLTPGFRRHVQTLTQGRGPVATRVDQLIDHNVREGV